MDRRLLTSAVMIHAGACLVAVMAMGSASPFDDEAEARTSDISEAKSASREDQASADLRIESGSDSASSESGSSRPDH